jgi:CubicO group peptidase (beta-lactamase class C family)
VNLATSHAPATTLDTWPNVAQVLDAEVQPNSAWGVQLCVLLDGAVVLETAVGGNGLGQAMQLAMPFRVYCTTKPVLAVAIARLVAGAASSSTRRSAPGSPTAVTRRAARV